jgi:ferritin-like metal-binding protein YciE
MEKLKDLKDLLTHEIHDLLSAEDQIIEALPLMITKAVAPSLRKALREHLRITEMQRKRLDQVNSLMGEAGDNNDRRGVSSFLAKLFGNGVHKCKGMEGLISEGNKVMALDMNPEVLDAAIIACAQKIEHYEICGYGTARAYAKELNLSNVTVLLEETLNEEYAADDILTKLALGGLNEEAEHAEKSIDGDGIRKAKPAGAKGVGAKRFFGNDNAPKKSPAADSKTRTGKKNTSPNRRQVTPKETGEGKSNFSRNSSADSQRGRASAPSNKRSAGGPAQGRYKPGSSGRPASSSGRSLSSSKGKSSGGKRGPTKGGGSRGHK